MRLIALPLVAALALAACKKDAEQQAAPPPPEVGVITLQPSQAAFQLELAGRLAPFRSADVRARVPGVVQRRVYEEGSQVKKGQLLFVIDPATLRAALAEAQAAQAQAQASHTNAKVNADRARKLAPTQYISKADIDNALAAERTAAGALQAARAAVQSAQINLGYASVTSPITGQSNKAQVTEGALVGQGTPTLLTTIDQLDPLYANFSLSSTELDQIRAQQSQAGNPDSIGVEVLQPNGKPYPHAGKLDFTSDVVDPATGAVSMRAILPNPEKLLRPGTYVTLKTTLGTQDGVFLVPQAAVQRDAASAYVLVVGDKDVVARKNISPSRPLGTNWVVESGLAAGDRVIVTGLQKAKPEAPVKPVPYDPNAAPQGPAAPAGAAPAAPKAPDAAPATPGKQDSDAAKPAADQSNGG